MKKIIIAFTCILLCFALSFSVLSHYSELDQLWAARADMDNVLQGKELSIALLAASDDTEVLWRLARFYYWLGDFHAQNDDEMLQYYRQGEYYAEKGKELDSECVNSLYWFAVLTGRVGQSRGILQSLFMVRPMRNALEAVLEIDPDFADAHYVLGMLYRLVPGWPLSIGNINTSLEYAERAVELNPANLDYQVSLAETLLEIRGERNNARIILEHVLEAPLLEGSEIESERAKADAAEILAANF